MNRAVFLGLLCALLATGPGAAHVVEQLFAEVTRDQDGWRLEVLYDAGYALPEARNDPSTPQPTRDWLRALNEEAHAELRTEAARYLREWVSLEVDGRTVPLHPAYPDWDQAPPAFPRLLNGGAYFRMVFAGPWPGESGALSCTLKEGTFPNLVFQLGENQFLTAKPGGKVLLVRQEASAPEEEAGKSGLWWLFGLGFQHVLPDGLDHLLFILGLFLLQRDLKKVVVLSLCFTAAHTVTLGVMAAGMAAPSPALVEPLIGLSIALVGVEVLRPGERERRRAALVFAFGLVHGLGFGGSLAPTIQAYHPWGLALVVANLGVEVAQVAVLAGAWFLTMGWSESTAFRRTRLVLALGLVGIGITLALQRSTLLAGSGI